MKSLFATLLLASLTGIAVFGVFSMSHTGAHDMSPANCIAATAKGTDCPKEAKPIDFATFHIDAYNRLSLATVSEDAISALVSAFASLTFIGSTLFSLGFFKPPHLAWHRLENALPPLQQQELTRWLALHENSPAFS
jgi:hypothetical protein